MILLAELTGSDYTEGVESVGPVTALEILADFPGNGLEPLLQFRRWWDQHQTDYNLPPGSKLREKLVRLRLPSGNRAGSTRGLLKARIFREWVKI
jgi:DNA excision repair protein ERCC-5